MSLELYIGFVLASSLILIIPGPTIILVVSQAIAQGKRSVVPLAAGVVAGDFTAMTLSLVGVGSLLSVSAELFTMLSGRQTLDLKNGSTRDTFRPGEESR